MIVAGVMSGTSADGIDVALVRIEGRGFRSRLDLLAHSHVPYRRDVRLAVLAAMNARSPSVAELSRLNFLLGELYADAVLKAQQRSGLQCELVGCHGQTLYHQGTAERFLGRQITCTWQTGEGAVIASRIGVPVVSDFRPADMAAGGKGAPLVPFLDYGLYRHARVGRIVQNIGGIANLTAIPAGAQIENIRVPQVSRFSKPGSVMAFDTGPGNMVIDAVTEKLFGQPYDRNGQYAARGKPIEDVLRELLRDPYFRQKPPKTAGREQFGREFVSEFLRECGRADKHDIVATATALTARSIAAAIRTHVLTSGRDGNFREMIASGGGTQNRTLMRLLTDELAPMNIKLSTTDKHGPPSAAKEAAAFALLAYETWHRRPSNIPSATGAKRPAILGKISYP
jgi:anhydro-N-acetylmuramic acid kinase